MTASQPHDKPTTCGPACAEAHTYKPGCAQCIPGGWVDLLGSVTEAECPDPASGAGVPCSAAVLQRPHAPHDWQPQPGMDPVHCPGVPAMDESAPVATWAQRCSCGGQGITHLHAEHHEPVGPADVDPFAGRACPVCGDYVTGPCPECAPRALSALARARDTTADTVLTAIPELATEPADTIAVPLAAFDRLVAVAAHVSLGKSAAFNQRAYPDATARAALGALDDAGLMDGYRQRHPEPGQCQRCKGHGIVPDWTSWDQYHGEPKPKPCPDCATKEPTP